MAKRYEHHPLAGKFPMTSEAQYEALKRDLQENGQQEPIYLFEGKILDGRNRYRACLELGLKPNSITLKNLSLQEAAAFSAAKNLLRRHLTKSQQAMYLVEAGLLEGDRSDGAKRQYRTGELAVRRISKRYGVSHVSVYKAMFVKERDAELAERVLNGQVSVAKAESIIRERELAGQASPEMSSGMVRLSKTIQRTSVQLGRLQDELAKASVLPEGPGKGLKMLNARVHDTIEALKSFAVHPENRIRQRKR